MSGATFGRKGAGADADLAARRAAFLAEERARSARAANDVAEPGFRPAAASRPVFIREKSLGTAYLLWFFLGGLSAHRFYLGLPSSGAIQLVLTPLGYGLLLGKSPVGLLVLLFVWVWILSDAFVIPSLARNANERVRRTALGPVFA
ncbi:MAG TPA: TM2 domain-containing protein [Allosphingosinicella sp.]|nr:TM2 domain-containing protein [Allosphingosinicella sp.]